MSEAFAKMRLSSEVSEEDVEEAVTLMEKATLSSATNPETGIIDMDSITTGRSALARKRVEEIAHGMRQFLFANETKYRKQHTMEALVADFNAFENNRKLEVTRDEFFEAFKLLQSDELLVMYGQSKQNPHIKLQYCSEE
jgi:DNA replicative helicase MCM subunit Mcm2 (Cdc46/Mcm family)